MVVVEGKLVSCDDAVYVPGIASNIRLFWDVRRHCGTGRTLGPARQIPAGKSPATVLMSGIILCGDDRRE